MHYSSFNRCFKNSTVIKTDSWLSIILKSRLSYGIVYINKTLWFARQLSIQVTICKENIIIGKKVWPSTRSLGSHGKAYYKGPQNAVHNTTRIPLLGLTLTHFISTQNINIMHTIGLLMYEGLEMGTGL